MGGEPDDVVVVLRNPARGREWLGASAFLPLTLVSLFNPRIPGWVRIAMMMQFRPVEDESAASTVALLEFERRRLGGAARVEGPAIR